MTFKDHWEFVKGHCKILAQNYEEMEHIYNLITECEAKSYLEIGTAEGNSLYVFGRALPHESDLTYVDMAEAHTKPYRESVIAHMKKYTIHGIHGNSHHPDVIKEAQKQHYDIVYIDAGHSYNDALQDARNYAPLADKYVFFHDVQMPEVMEAYKQWQEESSMKGYTVIHSDNYGYGVIKV